MDQHLLSIILLTPLAGLAVLLFIRGNNTGLTRLWARSRAKQLHHPASGRAQPAFSGRQLRSCNLALRRNVLPRSRPCLPRTPARFAAGGAGVLSGVGTVRPALLAKHDGRGAQTRGR